jgi:hypothetical protein
MPAGRTSWTVRGPSKVGLMALGAAALLSSGWMAVAPSSAGAAPTDPLGPTIAQVEAAVNTTLTNVKPEVNAVLFQVDNALYLLNDVKCIISAFRGPERSASVGPEFQGC